MTARRTLGSGSPAAAAMAPAAPAGASSVSRQMDATRSAGESPVTLGRVT